MLKSLRPSFAAALLLVLAAALHAEPPAGPITDWLVLPPPGNGGRIALHTDAVEHAVATGAWTTPAEGDAVTRPDGARINWNAATAADNGWVDHPHLRGGYALATVTADERCVMMLNANGHSMVYINGRPRGGDPYQTGMVSLPVLLEPGDNEFLFRVGRGRLRAELESPPGELFFSSKDRTMPDLRPGEPGAAKGAIIVVNATSDWSGDFQIESDAGRVAIRSLPPCSFRKVPAIVADADIDEAASEVKTTLRIVQGADVRDETTVTLRVRGPEQVRRVTFESGIDDSVQYYAHRPRQDVEMEGRPALTMTLHGASVEALGQARSYGAKDWTDIVAPTNRRPFGFDWEDWGRIDAMEVLDDAIRRLDPDPQRILLTGHSMGGHGAWAVGAHFPHRFAAIAPCASWETFWSYTGAPTFDDSPIGRMLNRCANASRIDLLRENHAQYGVYILHGDADRTVPVREARAMVSHLADFHRDFAYHERAGAGHWPDGAIQDWPALFDFLKRKRLDPAPDAFAFTTVNPRAAATCHWIRIDAPAAPLEPSRADVRRDDEAVRISTTNIIGLTIERDALINAEGDRRRIEIDGDDVSIDANPDADAVALVRNGDAWSFADAPVPHNGPRLFREIYDNRFLIVIATGDDGWALDKARFDAETFWYRGNGRVEIITDADFLAMPEAFDGRNIILYGDADTNAAWGALLGDAPFDVRRDTVRLGGRTINGDLGVLLAWGRVGVIAGTSDAGRRTLDRLPIFLSGAHFPQALIVSPDVLMKREGGVVGAGFLGDGADFVWRGE
ncbi:MAG: prolyl oligopeptidase family serine peptidase [Phycisphaerales bacterium]